MAATINAMRPEITFLCEESPEGGYEAHALGHAIFTQADTLDELREMALDAARCHFDDDVKFSHQTATLFFLKPVDTSVILVVC